MNRSLLGLIFFVSTCAHTQTLLTVNGNNQRDGANTTEYSLTPAKLSAGFGKIGAYSVTGYVFAQTLFVPAVSISGTNKNLLIVTSLANNIYAFDADRVGSSPIWTATFGAGFGSFNLAYNQSVGCMSTPVADSSALNLYAVCQNAAGDHILRVLSLTDGSTLNSVVIAGQVIGTGDPIGGDTTSGANLLFYPAKELQRPGLTLANGMVYVTFGGVGDVNPWHGWIFAYNTSDLSQAGIFCASPNGEGAAIWGGAPSVDVSGNLYVTTGNGCTYNPAVGCYSNSLVKLSPTLALLDWFTPLNNVAINATDSDVSSNRAILIPGTTFIALASKDPNNVYILDTTCLGHLQDSGPCAYQTFPTAGGTPTAFSGAYGGTYLNEVLYLPTTAGSIYAFSCPAGVCNPTPLATNLTSYGTFGPCQMSSSSNGAASGIVWVTTTPAGESSFIATHAGTLRAVNPATLIEYWNSGMVLADALGTLSKFASPTIANGKVHVVTQDGRIVVYGMPPGGDISIGGGIRFP